MDFAEGMLWPNRSYGNMVNLGWEGSVTTELHKVRGETFV